MSLYHPLQFVEERSVPFRSKLLPIFTIFSIGTNLSIAQPAWSDEPTDIPLPKFSQCLEFARNFLEKNIPVFKGVDFSQPKWQPLLRCDELIVFYTLRSRPGSMFPTLKFGQRILVDKTAYRQRQPQRGDIIVFNPPEQLQKENYSQPFIKRIIGLPGDKIAVRNGRVYVNSKPIQEPYVKELPTYTMESTKVPKNSYFVLGDNRNNSYDSYYWGALPRYLIIGKSIGVFNSEPTASDNTVFNNQKVEPKEI